MVKILTISKTRVSLAQIDVTPNYRPSSYSPSFSQLVPALLLNMFFYLCKKCNVSEINVFLLFTQKFKMATKSGGKTIFGGNRSIQHRFTHIFFFMLSNAEI